ncbi:MAG: repeat containing protein, partial [Bryobacterales bacterium]|nr:repeat containing protein [Bryobacterales bacterium]
MAADFTTGQAARMVIGQRTFTAAEQGASQSMIGAAGGLAYANNSLFVADSNRIGAVPVNNRVLIYHNISSAFPAPGQEAPQGSRCPVCGGTADVVLGQPDFTKTDAAATQAGMRLPTDVATDGHILAVADTDNNRVLIWKTIPNSNDAPPDVVVGQPDFTTTGTSVPPTAKSMRGPQGLWIQNGKLFVADTQDHRVLIYNSIPTSNGASADLVLGQPNFTTFVEPDLTQQKVDAKPNNMLNPVSVTSDGVRLYVTDLGQNRVLIWNSIPTQNQQAADLALGQPDMTSSLPNNSTTMCASNGKDATTGALTYPALCSGTMSFPRYALSDGNWLFVADGGNDRILVYHQVPTANGAAPDLILGQTDGFTADSSDGVDRLRTPMSLAWDGTNLFVSDTYNRRIVVYSPGDANVPFAGVRNAASLQVFAVGAVIFGGTINAGDVVTITIGGT